MLRASRDAPTSGSEPSPSPISPRDSTSAAEPFLVGTPSGDLARDVETDNIRCVPRTTIDIDSSVLRELKRRQRTQKKSLGQLASELLAQALATEGTAEAPAALSWTSKPLGLKVDLDDKEALWGILDSR